MGITFDKEKQLFVLDFEHDGADDIVSLTGSGYQVEAFGNASTMVMSFRILSMVVYVLLLSDM